MSGRDPGEPPLVVRDARAGEGVRLGALVAGQPLLVRYEMTAERLGRALDEAVGRGDTVLVAEGDAAAPLGFAWFLPGGTFAQGGYLRLIALAPGSEGKGAGSALLGELERRVAQASRHLFLLCSHWNEPAQRFYQSRGYLEVGRLPAFVRADTDELIFWKRLR